MRMFEFVIALIVAVVLFVVLKLIGLILKFALIAAPWLHRRFDLGAFVAPTLAVRASHSSPKGRV